MTNDEIRELGLLIEGIGVSFQLRAGCDTTDWQNSAIDRED